MILSIRGDEGQGIDMVIDRCVKRGDNEVWGMKAQISGLQDMPNPHEYGIAPGRSSPHFSAEIGRAHV